MSYSVSLSNSELTFANIPEGKQSVTVSVDGSSKNNSFRIEYNTDSWFHVERKRNTLEITVEDWDGEEDRSVEIRVIHNCDGDVYTHLTVTQKAVEYVLRTSTTEKQFALFEEDELKLSIGTDIVVKGGCEDFFIKSIRQYTGKTITYGTDNKTYEEETDYDGGIVVTKTREDDGKYLLIKSYGRTFVDDGNYYVVTLAHRDNRKVTVGIKLTYALSEQKTAITPTSVSFDYLGNVTDGSTDTIDISFGDDSADYGYKYEYGNEDDSEWLTLEANPTSITCVAASNSNSSRTATVKVASRDDEEGSEKWVTFVVTQGEVPSNVIYSRKAIAFSYNDYGEDVEETVTIRKYGTLGSRGTAPTVSGGWLTSEITKQEGKFCDIYTISMYPTARNSGSSDRSTTIDGSIKVTQSSKNTVEPIKIADKSVPTITVTTEPTDSVITANATAKWCTAVISGHTVTVKCDENPWAKDRKCRIILTNSEDTSKTVKVDVTEQASSSSFSFQSK